MAPTAIWKISAAVWRKSGIPKLIKPIKYFATKKFIPYRHSQVSEKEWDDEYQSGRWDYLKTIEQLARYKVIEGYCEHYIKQGDILDVGCGEGYLQTLLGNNSYNTYIGLDISAEAIALCVNLQDEKTSFVHANAETFEAEHQFDIIIFNECLNYFEKPIEVLTKFNAFLKPKGVFVISIFGWRAENERRWRAENERLWKLVESKHKVLDEVKVEHNSGKNWLIKVLVTREA